MLRNIFMMETQLNTQKKELITGGHAADQNGIGGILIIDPVMQKMREKMSDRAEIDAHNNGGSTDYYAVPEEAETLSDLIEHKRMEHGIGEAFAALYRLNDKDTRLRNLHKAQFFIDREIKRELKAMNDSGEFR